MPPSTCCFCAHLNPARAKFCNECASPLHLKPCRQCDAVNARDASTCYRCAAALAPALTASETSAERIVADANETLAALQRELVAPATPRADVVVTASDVAAAMHERGEAGDALDEQADPPDTGESSTLDAALSALRARSQAAAREPSVQAGTRADDAPAARDDLRTAPAETPVLQSAPPPSFMAVDPDDRQWRPERRSRAPVLLALLALLAVPAALYWFYNPAQVDAWLGRTSSPPADEATLTGTTPAVQAPAATAASPAATNVGEGAAVAVPAAAAVAPPVQESEGAPVTPATPEASQAGPGTGWSEAAPAAAGVAAAATAAPERTAKSPPSRAKSAGASGRSRERPSKPRPKAAATQSPRRAEPPAEAESSSRAEPCPPSVAALGLCNS